MLSKVDDRPLLKTRTPDRNATPSTIARPLITSRTLRASRLRRVSLSTSVPQACVVRAAARSCRRVMCSRICSRCGALDLVDHQAVGEEDHAVAVRRGDRVVGDHHDRLAEVVHAAPQERQHLGARRAVQVAGGLVREDDRGLAGQCPGTGHALLLPAGQLATAGGRAGRAARRPRPRCRATPGRACARPGRAGAGCSPARSASGSG